MTDHHLPGPDRVRVRFYRPRETPSRPLPCLVWIHGGGMVRGTPEMDDARVSAYVLEAGFAVASVDYPDGVLPHLSLPRRAAGEQIAVLRRALGGPTT
ncbi:alpha/beta hydrolase [Streptomyces anulatus]|uniref:alpha/beta hydrolase n=1 Tax=Streptomyces anulatus TaxID=1892 RepID=UPI0036C376D2